MKKLFCSLLLSFGVAHAEPFELTAKVFCDSADVIIDQIIEKYEERPIWAGSALKNAQTVLFVNDKTKTWSLLAIHKDKACVLATGQDFKLRLGKEI